MPSGYVAEADRFLIFLLTRDFATKLLTFMRFQIPTHDIRTALWRALLPPTIPLAADINFETLGRHFEMNPGSIRSAVASAASEAACKGTHYLILMCCFFLFCDNPAVLPVIDLIESLMVCQKDLLLAGEQELSKVRRCMM